MPTIRGAARRAYGLAYTKILPRLVDTRFVLDGRTYEYLWDPAEETWRAERAVEIPIGLAALTAADPARTLEVGNVLRKFSTSTHAVIDKYERADGVVNADALEWIGGPYELIVSISTLEHVGYDEQPRDALKAVRAIEHLRRLLAPGGTMLATIPLGYNRDLDDALRDGSVGAHLAYLARRSELRWEQVEAADPGWPWASGAAVYGWPWPGANVLAIATWGG